MKALLWLFSCGWENDAVRVQYCRGRPEGSVMIGLDSG
jgi:hypothetical protein